jgi:hypothetical protein
MPTEHTSTSSSGLDTTKLLSELEVPFSPDQVRCGLLLGARGCESWDDKQTGAKHYRNLV